MNILAKNSESAEKLDVDEVCEEVYVQKEMRKSGVVYTIDSC